MPLRKVDPCDACCKCTTRASQNCSYVTTFDDPAAVQHDNGVGKGQRIQSVVRDEHGRAISCSEHPTQQRPQCRGGGDVERRHRFVEQE